MPVIEMLKSLVLWNNCIHHVFCFSFADVYNLLPDIDSEVLTNMMFSTIICFML